MTEVEETDGEDPFAMFGEAEDDADGADDDAPRSKDAVVLTTPSPRDPANGFNLYHTGTEQAMVHHVRTYIEEQSSSTESRLDRAIALVDEFCQHRHWMMHIGPDKGQLLDDFLAQRVQAYLATTTTTFRRRPFLLLEVGTYCGYSTARLVRTLQREFNTQLQQEKATAAFHIITVDVDPLHTNVAQQLHKLAFGTNEGEHNNSSISYITMNPETDNLVSSVQRSLEQYFQKQPQSPQEPSNDHQDFAFDFIFLDHDKDLYLADLQQLEQARMIRGTRTAVAADNVVFFRLESYISYMQQGAQQGIVSTQTVLAPVEYIGEWEKQQAVATMEKEGPHAGTTNDNSHSDDAAVTEFWQDGLELSIYLQDPIQHDSTVSSPP